MRDRFRSVSILKNRDGAADVRIGLQFVGEVGYFQEIPKASEMNDELYRKIVNLENYKKWVN